MNFNAFQWISWPASQRHTQKMTLWGVVFCSACLLCKTIMKHNFLGFVSHSKTNFDATTVASNTITWIGFPWAQRWSTFKPQSTTHKMQYRQTCTQHVPAMAQHMYSKPAQAPPSAMPLHPQKQNTLEEKQKNKKKNKKTIIPETLGERVGVPRGPWNHVFFVFFAFPRGNFAFWSWGFTNNDSGAFH